MRRTLPKAGILLFLGAFSASLWAQPDHSILSQGDWAKFSTTRNGIFRIDYDALAGAGFDPDHIDPRRLQLFGFPTGMLPQAIATSRTSDLVELAVLVTGQDDGRFDRGDALVFYGEGPDRIVFDPDKDLFSYQNNLFTDKNFYFLTVGAQNGKRVQKAQPLGSGFNTVQEFRDVAIYETDEYNDLKSGREWFGEQFDARLEITIRFEVPGIVENSAIKVVSGLMTQSYTESSFRVFWNNFQLLDKKMEPIPETQYGLKGRVSTDTITTTASAVSASGSTNQDVRIQFVKGPSGRSVGYLNNVQLNVRRELAWYGNPTLVTIPPQTDEKSEIEVTGVPSASLLWDVSDPFNAIEPVASKVTGVLRFAAQTDASRQFALFSLQDLPIPNAHGKIANQDLRALPAPDLLIVTHPNFLNEATRLATHRSKTYGIQVSVVTTDQIYHEFSGGKLDVTAIRDFARILYMRTPGKLKNLLLFGRGSYDYKDRVFNNSNYVPTYQSRKTLEPLETFSSDDYFTFMEVSEGDWGEDPAANHTLDIGVGRIPVRSAKDAQQAVDKLIAYDTSPDRYAGWRQEILFVADDGDFNIHQSQADQLAEDIEINHRTFHTDKLYLDSFEQEERASGQFSPKAAAALNQKINKGFAIVNFTGHGSEQVWMQERILDGSSSQLMKNHPQLPLFVTATCEFGRHDNPLLISTAENLLLARNVGAIGLVTTTRPVNSSTNFTLNRAFYSSLFAVSGGAKDLGTIFKETKNNSVSGTSNRNFSLLGDPSLRFGPPAESVYVTAVKTINDSDTLKALSMVIVEGEIRNGPVVSEDFSGTVELALMDKRSQLMTLGDENPEFPYQLWDHKLFRGRAGVENGRFAAGFVLPVNLAPQIGDGKLVLYAFSVDKSREALGTFSNFKVGGAESNPGDDNKGPSLELFMGDTTFVDGGHANSDTRVVGRLSDQSGINISGYDPSNVIITLDGTTDFILNDYFVADEDDYTRGSFSFPINDLTEGPHTMRLRAWDNHNNSSEVTITFVVAKEGKLVIEEFKNYPNPFSESTMLQFTHNRSGEDLEAQVAIYNVMGQVAEMRQFAISSSSYKVTLFEWNGHSTTGTKMTHGVYLMKLSVRSLADGAKNEKIAKLILVN